MAAGVVDRAALAEPACLAYLPETLAVISNESLPRPSVNSAARAPEQEPAAKTPKIRPIRRERDSTKEDGMILSVEVLAADLLIAAIQIDQCRSIGRSATRRDVFPRSEGVVRP